MSRSAASLLTPALWRLLASGNRDAKQGIRRFVQGWLGEKGMWIEPQPWAIIGGITSEEQTQVLVQSIDEELRRGSPLEQSSSTTAPIGRGMVCFQRNLAHRYPAEFGHR